MIVFFTAFVESGDLALAAAEAEGTPLLVETIGEERGEGRAAATTEGVRRRANMIVGEGRGESEIEGSFFHVLHFFELERTSVTLSFSLA